MIKRWRSALTLILICILIGVSVLIGLNLTQLSKEIQVGSVFDEANPPSYRYMVILDGSDPTYVDKMTSGMDKASEDYSVVFELWRFDSADRRDRIIRQLDIGIESSVDGIILQAFEDERFDDLFIKAKRYNIPIITIANDVPSQEKVSFITYNKYQMGSRIGRLLHETLIKENYAEGTIAIIQNSALFNQDQAFAIQEELPSGFQVRPIKETSQSDTVLNSEGLASEVIRDYPDLRAFICLSGEDTIGVIQALKDANKLNEVLVIGSDDDEEILDYINRGVLSATIVPDIENIGYEAILDLNKYNEGMFVSQYRDIAVKIVDKSNLSTYLEELEDREDE